MPDSRRPAWMVAAIATLVVLVVTACERHVESDFQNTNAATPARPAIGAFGFDSAGMDRTTTPGDDFFGYANGSWAKTTEIPADRASYDSSTRIVIETEKRVHDIIEGAAANDHAYGEDRKIGDYYAAFMDEAGIEDKGIAPLRPRLEAIARIADKRSLATTFGAQLRNDVDLFNAIDLTTERLFGLWVSQDLHRPDRCVPYLVQGGLGLPTRSFYLDGGPMVELREAYHGYIARLLTQAGIDDAVTRAKRILALEIEIARVHAGPEQSNDVQRGANLWTSADFARRAPGLDWEALLQAAGLAAQRDFIVWQPQAVTGIAALVATQPLDNWKDYLAFHAINRAAPYLSSTFADEHFAFHGTTLEGMPRQRARWRRGIDATNAALGEAVGRRYVDRYVDAATKERTQAIVSNLIDAFARRIDALAWMSPQTKRHARAKIANLRVAIGYPRYWRDYSMLDVRRDDALGNAERAELFDYQRNLAKLGRPVDRNEWYLLPQTVNALNLPLENRLIFPAAILQPPFFDPAADDAVNYGAIGAVIGHEISHSLDNIGALFDEHGTLRDWWTHQDKARFDAAAGKLARQFDLYRPFANIGINGALTLSENIADVAGLAAAYDAYRLSLRGRAPQTLDGFSADQRFFLSFAQTWRGKYRDTALRNALLTDQHAPHPYRAQTVRNLDAWYSAFQVRPGQRLYLPPQQRVRIW